MILYSKRSILLTLLLGLAPGINSIGDAEYRRNLQEIKRKLEDANRYIIEGDDATEKAVSLGAKLISTNDRRGFNVVEFPTIEAADAMLQVAQSNDYTMEKDHVREKIRAIDSDKSFTGALAETIPYGISRTYLREGTGETDIPDAGYFPETATHKVCILDTGYEIDHKDLPDDAFAADPDQGCSGDTCAFPDCESHGTHVAGTVGATGGNGKGVVGVWPGAPTMGIVKVFLPLFGFCIFTYSSDLVKAIDHCNDSGADVVSMSLGGPSYSGTENAAFNDLYNNDNMLFIAAAGNGGDSSYSYPASYDNVMSVGATDISDEIIGFSQYNDQVEISAPGVDVLSTVPKQGYDYYSGTSMATPHVAGAALVLWNKFPTKTNAEVREALNEGAIDKGTPGRDIYYGYGILNYWNSVGHFGGDICTEDPAKEVAESFDGTEWVFTTCGEISQLQTCSLAPRSIADGLKPSVVCPKTCGSATVEDPSALAFGLINGNVRSITCNKLSQLDAQKKNFACTKIKTKRWNDFDAGVHCPCTCTV